MNEKHGMYVTALTRYEALTGGSVDEVEWVPSEYPELSNDLPIIRQTVKDAVKNPLWITEQSEIR